MRPAPLHSLNQSRVVSDVAGGGKDDDQGETSWSSLDQFNNP
jgi:hypothetical protein